MSAPPAPMATPTTPALSARESLIPSPTTIGRKPLPISPSTRLSLSSGRAWASTSLMPTSSARLSATL